jgi:hypothetical protein
MWTIYQDHPTGVCFILEIQLRNDLEMRPIAFPGHQRVDHAENSSDHAGGRSDDCDDEREHVALRRNFQSSLLERNALKVFCNYDMSYKIARCCLRFGMVFRNPALVNALTAAILVFFPAIAWTARITANGGRQSQMFGELLLLLQKINTGR